VDLERRADRLPGLVLGGSATRSSTSTWWRWSSPGTGSSRSPCAPGR
jgi:hypothetical protein